MNINSKLIRLLNTFEFFLKLFSVAAVHWANKHCFFIMIIIIGFNLFYLFKPIIFIVCHLDTSVSNLRCKEYILIFNFFIIIILFKRTYSTASHILKFVNLYKTLFYKVFKKFILLSFGFFNNNWEFIFIKRGFRKIKVFILVQLIICDNVFNERI